MTTDFPARGELMRRDPDGLWAVDELPCAGSPNALSHLACRMLPSH